MVVATAARNPTEFCRIKGTDDVASTLAAKYCLPIPLEKMVSNSSFAIVPYPCMASAGEGRPGRCWGGRPESIVSTLGGVITGKSGALVGKARTAAPCVPCIAAVVKEGRFCPWSMCTPSQDYSAATAARRGGGVNMKTAALLQWALSRVQQQRFEAHNYLRQLPHLWQPS